MGVPIEDRVKGPKVDIEMVDIYPPFLHLGNIILKLWQQTH